VDLGEEGSVRTLVQLDGIIGGGKAVDGCR